MEVIYTLINVLLTVHVQCRTYIHVQCTSIIHKMHTILCLCVTMCSMQQAEEKAKSLVAAVKSHSDYTIDVSVHVL